MSQIEDDLLSPSEVKDQVRLTMAVGSSRHRAEAHLQLTRSATHLSEVDGKMVKDVIAKGHLENTGNITAM